ncbi:MAG TPA: 3-isopropylmalate dehydratase small subunit [Polyangiaceae bacterium]|nr:3-isopropylmalate dehydratase small subunit [Polyangiaceae bacterium]
MEPIRTIRSRFVLLPVDDADTDQIIPARFLKTTSRAGLGAYLFADRRGPDFPLDRPEARGAHVLVAGRNFGCGSSREHAPWALGDAGFRAIIALGIADIFRANAIKNGIVPVVVDEAFHARLTASPGAEVVIDLDKLTVCLENGGPTAPFSLDPFSRHCLMAGVDELGLLLAEIDSIAAYEKRAEAAS